MAFTVVIFGASGDLTRRKLVPALYNLFQKERLPAGLRVVGFARRPYSDQAFRAHLEEGVQDFAGKSWNAGAWDAFSGRLHYFQGDLRAVDDFRRLNAYLEKLEGNEVGDRLYYLATAPAFYTSTVAHLGEANLHQGEGGGADPGGGKTLWPGPGVGPGAQPCLHAVFDETRSTASTITWAKRRPRTSSSSALPTPSLNRSGTAVISTTCRSPWPRAVDVGHRAGYYDTAGVLRDMFQNHLLQLLTLVAMEPPASFDADALRNEKVKVLSAIRPVGSGGHGARPIRRAIARPRAWRPIRRRPPMPR